MRHFLFILFLVTVIGHRSSNLVSAQTDWPMTAANPQRTSHNDVEVRGPLRINWYRVIDPFIDSKVQVIATDGKVFISTSKGLYAFDAANGNQLWVYGTTMPLGHSPTIAMVNGQKIAYVPGYDHRIHSIKISDGTPLSGYTPYIANAGFESNPLVVNDTYASNLIVAGNRDGNLYGLDSVTGTKRWSYQTNGPIRFSPAYKNGVVYIASDDSYVYAINVASGTLKWRSEKLPGYGFATYWPVIWTDTYPSSSTYAQDFVLITASEKAATYGWWGSENNYQAENHAITTSCSSTGNQNYLWNNSIATVINCTPIYNYFNSSRPDRRNLFIFNTNQAGSTAVEHTPYAPINWSGASHGGNKYPPVIGDNGVIYTHIGYNTGGNGGCSGYISGWKFGTSYIQKIWDRAAACDEPPAFTSGASLIHWGEGVNFHSWGTVDVNQPIGSNFYSWEDPRWVAGAQEKYFFDAMAPDLVLNSTFGSAQNGVYSYYDGVTNQSPIPYNGKLYLLNSNVLYSLSSTGNQNHLSTVNTPTTTNNPPVALTKNGVKALLEAEIQKIIAAGHLRPGYYNFGYVNKYSGLNYVYQTGVDKRSVVAGTRLHDYFQTPGETLATLAAALPHLNPTLQNTLKTYLRNEQSNYPVQTYAHIGWKNGAKREIFDDTPELTSIMQGADYNAMPASDPLTSTPYLGCCATWVDIGDFPPDAFYGAWKYAAAVLTQNESKTLFDNMKSKLQVASTTDLTNAYLLDWPYILNQYINGYRGYMELEKLAGYTTAISQSNKYAEYQRLLNLRVNNFSKDSPFINYPGWEYHSNYAFNIARNFMWLTPELGESLSVKSSQVDTAISEYQTLAPYWFVPKYERTYAEGVGHHLYDRWALFQAKAYILHQPFNELVKYLDVPAFDRGDLFYIQNLVAALEAPEDPNYTPPPASPTPGLIGDLDHDGDIDFLDLLQLITNFNTNGIGNFNLNSLVDVFDYNQLIIHF